MNGNIKGLLMALLAALPFFVWVIWPDALPWSAWFKLLACVVVGAGVVAAIPCDDNDQG